MVLITFLSNNFEFGALVSKGKCSKYSIKDAYDELTHPPGGRILQQSNLFSYFCRRPPSDNFCQIILNSDQLFMRIVSAMFP